MNALTDADRELIYQVTGQRVDTTTAASHGWISVFATAIAADRVSGRLASGQEVTAAYVQDLTRRRESSPAMSPLAAFLDGALRYLAAAGRRRVDVNVDASKAGEGN